MTEEEMDEWLRKAGVDSDEGADDEDDDEERDQLVIDTESEGPPELHADDPVPSTSAGNKLTAIEKVFHINAYVFSILS